jgi:O-antigen biosynthesis protein
MTKIEGEVFVVDNNSIDGSVEMVKTKFPQAHLVANKDNVGFSKANNQAMSIAKGEYILLLNPDTVVEEDTFIKCIQFMDEHPNAGGLGVRMIDGKGNFLPESKRGLPTPAAAFYKIFGISRLFPKSKRFSKYHLSYLDEFDINEIEVLSGAFMLMRKAALDKVGLLDEAFFMYGEDIDLSYRILLGGYKNYYFPKTQIIHYKGESTKKSSVNYVFVFYRAMIIFAEKHFSQKNAKLFSLLINIAIYFRASLAILSRFIKKSFLPLTDLAAGGGIAFALSKLWERSEIIFPTEVLQFSIPAYLIIWIIAVLFSGGYDRPIKLFAFVKGISIGTIVILAIYALIPKDFQFSRLYILAGATGYLFYFSISRILLSWLIGGRFDLNDMRKKTFAIVGTADEASRVETILKNSSQNIERLLYVSPADEKSDGQIGTLSQLDQIATIHKPDEIIFCAKDTSAESIIKWMSTLQQKDLDFKIAQPDSIYLIGSNSVDTAGDLYLMEINALSLPSHRRNKRTFDFIIGLLGLLFAPFFFWMYRNKKNYLVNMKDLLLGNISVVSYYLESNKKEANLPKLKAGILSPMDSKKLRNTDNQTINSQKINLIYAKNYSVSKDIQLLWENVSVLDR